MVRSTTQLRSQLFSPALQFAAARGGQLDGLLEHLGLTTEALSQAEVTLPLSTLHRFWEELERRTGDPLLGLHLGAELSRGSYGLLEYLGRSAATLEEALTCIARYAHLLDETAEVELTSTPSNLIFRHHVPGEPLALGRHGNECWVSTLVHRARELTGRRCRLSAVVLAHPAGPHVELAEAFDTELLVFGAEQNAIHLSREVAELAIGTADPALHQLLLSQARLASAQRKATSRYLGLVRQTVRDLMRTAAPTLETTAAALHRPPRWLQRRLADENTHFNDVLESIREELARTLATNRHRSVAEMSYELKYSDASVFIRAFKRWTGLTPGQYRARGAAAGLHRSVMHGSERRHEPLVSTQN